MSEDEPMEREVAIDPEMLGKVFENLLDASDRKSKGAFYTPREIVHYMCQETLINYLVSKMNLPEDDIRSVVMYGEIMKDEDTKKTQKYVGTDGKNHYKIDKEKELLIPESIFSFKKNINRLEEMDELLKKVRIADLAVGSGAFPVGMLNEIVRLREIITEYLSVEMSGFHKKSFISYGRKRYDLKVNTIRNCIFACDIEPSAVDIAKLRLWLSIVIDDELVENTSTGEFDEHTKPKQLPNLDCNIICGNSLVDEFYGKKLITESFVLGNVSDGTQSNIFQYSVDPLIKQLIELQDKLFFEKSHDEKESIKRQIEALYDNIVLEQGIKNDPETFEAYKEAAKQNSKPFILWQIYFPKVFKENGGFDIVIGNPPYVDSEEMTKSMPELRELYSKNFRSAKGNWDLFVLFIDYGLHLLRENGTISFIVPNKLISAPYAKEIRTMMSENYVREIRDYSNVNVFETAAVYPVVFRVTKSEQKSEVTMDVMDEIETIGNENIIPADKFYADTDWDKYFNASESVLNIVDKIASFPKLSTLASVNGAATVNEAYLVKEFLQDNEHLDESKRFINTGGIDKYKSFWGKEFMRYLKGKYMYPVATEEDIKNMSSKRFSECNKEKVIIGGMNKELECYYDNGNYLAGKSTTIVYDNDNLKYIAAVLNSTLMSFYYKKLFNSMSLAGGFFRIGAPQIKELPIATPSNADIDRISSLVDAIQDDMDQSGENYKDLYLKIDMEIYNAYGLTPEEIAIIKSDMEKEASNG
jgi:adenine-specific DNA-methyltransferase